MLVDIADAVYRQKDVSVDMGYVNVIWQGDAICNIIGALQHAAAPPFILNVAGEKILSVREIAQRFGELFGRSPCLVGSETETAWLNNAAFSHKLFGSPKVSVEHMMEWIADWIRQGGPSLDKPTQFQVRDGEY